MVDTFYYQKNKNTCKIGTQEIEKMKDGPDFGRSLISMKIYSGCLSYIRQITITLNFLLTQSDLAYRTKLTTSGEICHSAITVLK